MNTDHNFQNLVVKTEATNLSHLFNSFLKRDKKRKSMAYTAIDSYYVNELLKCAAVVAVQYPRK